MLGQSDEGRGIGDGIDTENIFKVRRNHQTGDGRARVGSLLSIISTSSKILAQNVLD